VAVAHIFGVLQEASIEAAMTSESISSPKLEILNAAQRSRQRAAIAINATFRPL
jgi:hypothetical protein